MKYYIEEYPSFEDIKDELTRDDLLDIIKYTKNIEKADINEIIQEYIEDNFEPTKVRDIDREASKLIRRLSLVPTKIIQQADCGSFALEKDKMEKELEDAMQYFEE